MSYSIDFRRKVLTIRDREGLSMEQAAQRFGIGKQTVYYWTKRLLEKKKRERMPQKLCLKALEQDIKDNPDA